MSDRDRLTGRTEGRGVRLRGGSERPSTVAHLTTVLRDGTEDVSTLLRAVAQALEAQAIVAATQRGQSVVAHAVWRSTDGWDDGSASLRRTPSLSEDPERIVIECARAIGVTAGIDWVVGRANDAVVVGVSGSTAPFLDSDAVAGVVDVLIAHHIEALATQTNAVQIERARIASAIHESVAQELTTLNMQLEVLQSMVAQAPERAVTLASEVRASVRSALRGLREAIVELTPISPSRSFERRLQRVVRELRASDVETTVQLDEEIAHLDDDVSDLVVAFLRESLTNTRKHGQNGGSVGISATEGSLKITVRTASSHAGFSVREGHGLGVMRAYARLLGGDVSTAHSRGTANEVTLTVPI